MVICRLIGILIVIATWFASSSAMAAKARKVVAQPESSYENKPIEPGATVWYCAYNGNTEISCRLGDAGDKDATRIPQHIDPRLPPLVHDIRNNPDRFGRSHVSIPLHTTPFDFEMVGVLAASVMCGGRALCGVIFAESSRKLDSLVAAFEASRIATRLARSIDTPPESLLGAANSQLASVR